VFSDTFATLSPLFSLFFLLPRPILRAKRKAWWTKDEKEGDKLYDSHIWLLILVEQTVDRRLFGVKPPAEETAGQNRSWLSNGKKDPPTLIETPSPFVTTTDNLMHPHVRLQEMLFERTSDLLE
jgi:hypothetical protein